LEVRFDKWRVKKQGQRIFKDVDLWNVVAVLPGKTMPETQILITAHYDSINMTAAPPAAAGQPAQSSWERGAELPAPGACDDASGTAAVMELARVMSQYDFGKTLVFAAFAGEEQGLVGSTLAAAQAKKEGADIEAVFNNDIIGTDRTDDGRTGNTAVNVYAGETMDSPSQQLGRYIHEAGARYVPAMKVNLVFLQDRLGRGGDHTPFQLEGFAAVRFTSAFEAYSHQHDDSDTLANMSAPYAAGVARVNAAAAAELALAPRTPVVTAGAGNATGASGGSPMISRGASRYDAALRWRYAGPDSSVAGFAIVMRPTTSAWWETEVYVGKTAEFTWKNVSIDDARFGVKAIAPDGSESLVAPYVNAPPRQSEIQVVE
jgi:hypothetical protein